MNIEVFDNRICALGEGPLWHPLRHQLFWVDILGQRLLSQSNGASQHWQFDEDISALAWVDIEGLLIASESGLYRFDIATGDRELLAGLETSNANTRSNDGRADPWGGFWIGTMGKNAESEAGAIYRFYQGEIRTLVPNVTISNSIAFSPDRQVAYYTDTVTAQIMQQPLSPADGWPKGPPKLFLDLRAEGLNPDGSVVDGKGCIWNAQWGAGRVARYSPTGELLSTIELPATQITCPAFGGDALTTLFVTSAAKGVDGAQDGMTFQVAQGVAGQQEHRVIL
ncbi:MAG: SMP-30/gluconolactonase/LRE family protein [Sulfitobacter sp.]